MHKPTGEKPMINHREIGSISFKFDKDVIEEIAAVGDLGNFVEKATELFRNDLKGMLVNDIASGSMAVAQYFNGEKYGGPPRPPKGPYTHIYTELGTITNRLSVLEALVKEVRRS